MKDRLRSLHAASGYLLKWKQDGDEKIFFK